jgi:hypothetical protein
MTTPPGRQDIVRQPSDLAIQQAESAVNDVGVRDSSVRSKPTRCCPDPTPRSGRLLSAIAFDYDVIVLVAGFVDSTSSNANLARVVTPHSGGSRQHWILIVIPIA